jgi:hypothetical protein
VLVEQQLVPIMRLVQHQQFPLRDMALAVGVAVVMRVESITTLAVTLVEMAALVLLD